MTRAIHRREFLAGMSLLAGASLAARAEAFALWTSGKPPVDVFAAQKAGSLQIKFIPKNAMEGMLQLTNATKQPLDVELPMGFAGAPVLAQFQPGGQGPGQAQGQSVGVGFGQRNQNNGPGNQNNNAFFMSIPPEKTTKLDVELLCLEHGKPNPRPAMAYEIKPIEEYTPRALVREFVRRFAAGFFAHGAAQAAAWHLANDMSWSELAALRVKRYATVVTPEPPKVFTLQELKLAQEIVERVAKAVDEAKKSQSSQSSQSAG